MSGANSWDRRYRERQYGDEPHPLVGRFAEKRVPGRALDIAAGAGRNAIRLAELGWRVTAVDYSRAALEIIQERFRGKSGILDCVLADLERHEFAVAEESYDLILLCNYLQRDLFPSIKKGTRAGGIVIAVIAIVDGDPHVQPMNPAFLLNPGELRSHFQGWTLLHDYEGKPAGDPNRRSCAEIVAQRPAPGGERGRCGPGD
jgi:SAM-dependent methyltransferase